MEKTAEQIDALNTDWEERERNRKIELEMGKLEQAEIDKEIRAFPDIAVETSDALARCINYLLEHDYTVEHDIELHLISNQALTLVLAIQELIRGRVGSN